LFTHVVPPTGVIVGPAQYPATWKLRAAQTGITTFTVSLTARRYCGYPEVAEGSGHSSPVTVITGTQVRLPAVYRLLSYLPPIPPPPAPAYIDLGTLGGPHSFAFDVNNRDQVVGLSNMQEEASWWEDGHAFLWQNGKLQDLGTLGGKHSQARHINDRGQIAGTSEFGAGEEEHAFFWENGRMRDVGTLGGAESWAVDLNEQGQVAGNSTTAAGDTHCFLWASGVMTDLGTLGGSTCYVADINDAGQVVGRSSTGSETWYTHAFLWANGVMTDLAPDSPPSAVSYAVAINNREQVIGSAVCPAADLWNCAVLWANGATYDLSYGGRGFDSGQLQGINDRGQVVGYGNFQPSPIQYGYKWDALLWDNGILINLGVQRGRWPNNPTLLNNRGQVVVDKNGRPALWHAGLLVPFAVPNGEDLAAGAAATAINDAGVVVGYSGHALLWRIEPPATP
jgi:probable HAF family extracellular repeat protein